MNDFVEGISNDYISNKKPFVPKYANYDYVQVHNGNDKFNGWIKIYFRRRSIVKIYEKREMWMGIQTGINNLHWANTKCKDGFTYLSRLPESKPYIGIADYYNGKQCPICRKSIEIDYSLVNDFINK